MSLFGSLIALDDTQAELDVPRVGRIHLQRSVINRMYRWKSSADLIYLGPNGLAGWRETSAKKGWKEEQGQPWTDQEGAAIRGDFKLPARATLEFTISWKNRPDFIFALGVSDDEKTIQRAFRFEVWERDLIIQRETEQEADVASVGEISPGSGRVHLIAYLDQERGRILVFSADGKPLADLKVAGGQQQVLGSISLANKRGDLRLERMRIGRWNGEPPREVARRQVAHSPGGRLDRLRAGQAVRRGQECVRDRRRQGRVPDPRGSDRGSLPVFPRRDEGPCPGGRLPGRIATERRPRSCGQELLEADRPGDQGAADLPLDGLRSLVGLEPQPTPAVDRRRARGSRARGGSPSRPPGRWARAVRRELPRLAAAGEQLGEPPAARSVGTHRLPRGPCPHQAQHGPPGSSSRPGRVRRGLPLGAERQPEREPARVVGRKAEMPVPAERRRDPFGDHQHRRERSDLPDLAFRQHVRRPRQDQGG